MSTTTVAATPATVNLVCYRGDSWAQTFRFLADDQPVDLTGLDVEAAARGTVGPTVALVVTVTDPTDGTIEVRLPDGGLAPDFYDYDVEVTDRGAVTTWVRGKLKVERDVTNE